LLLKRAFRGAAEEKGTKEDGAWWYRYRGDRVGKTEQKTKEQDIQTPIAAAFPLFICGRSNASGGGIIQQRSTRTGQHPQATQVTRPYKSRNLVALFETSGKHQQHNLQSGINACTS
ncbi:unnamed protein product, partial [Ectocarpus sp. 12 AP-2014]